MYKKKYFFKSKNNTQANNVKNMSEKISAVYL